MRKLAEYYTAEVGPILDLPVFDHNLGFLFFCRYGKGNGQTCNDGYEGTLIAWPRNVKMFGGHNSIMDTMMNLEMLFLAAGNRGDKHLYDIAVSHADYYYLEALQRLAGLDKKSPEFRASM